VLRGALLQAAAMAVVAFAPDAWVAVPAMFAAGMAWITTANTLSVSAQMGLPDWVRARGMSMYQMAIMGASALGAAVWGQVATVGSVQISLCVAAATGALTLWVTNRWMPHHVHRGRPHAGATARTPRGRRAARHRPGDGEHRIPHRPRARR
jgi:predicted MFS family arabinose efflux permease